MAENEAKETKEFNARKWIIWTIIISVIIVVGTAIFLVVTYSNDNSGRSLIEYIEQGIVILLAVAGGCSSIISMINGKKNNEEQQRREDALRNEQRVREDKLLKQQKEFEEKWNQKKIDADLKARARIEWIQEVRKVSSEFITSCYSLTYIIGYENDGFIQEHLLELQEKTAILKMYFGFDKEDAIKVDIFSPKTNEGKNQAMIELIESLSNEIMKLVCKDEFARRRAMLRESAKVEREARKKLLSENNQRNKLKLADELDKAIHEKDFQREKYSKLVGSNEKIIASYISRFTIAIRYYLKIEWDRAKNNED